MDKLRELVEAAKGLMYHAETGRGNIVVIFQRAVIAIRDMEASLAVLEDEKDCKRKGRCQQCGNMVDDEGWNGHTVVVYDGSEYPEPAPCGPVDFPERRCKDRRRTVPAMPFVPSPPEVKP